MGNGTRSGTLLNFQVTADYDLSSTDLGLWERAFSKASELLWNATEGQLRFGTIRVTENNQGAAHAELVLNAATNGRALGTFGQWGVSGRSIFLPAYAQEQVASILHELGHHIFALREEYARAEGIGIAFGASLPAGHGNRVIPLTATSSGEPDGNYAGADALLRFSTGPVETREIQSKVGNQITTTTAFSQNPQNSVWSGVTVQWTDGVECTGDTATGACLMEFSRSSAGDLQPDGTWEAAAEPVTEFCTEANHDPDGDTDQDSDAGEACWTTIVGRPGFTDLATGAPDTSDPASTTDPSGWTAPTWVVTDGSVRLALVLDRSGSMNRNSGARLAGVKTGAKFWIENAAVEDDQLTIVWYDNSADVQLPLTEFGSLSEAQVGAELEAIDLETAFGGTDIVEGLDAALNQLTGSSAASSVQASVLITDGAHNAPGTTMNDAVEPHQDAGASIYTLGVGEGQEMDLPGLSALASATGGTHQTAGDGADAAAIQAAMIEINALVRGGLVSSSGSGGGDTKRADDRLDDLAREADKVDPKQRPTLTELADKFDLRPFDKVLAGDPGPHRYTWFGLEVEKGARATTFTLSHAEDATYWMYLIDPDGREVHPSSGQVVAWNAGAEPYEFAKIKEPVAGQWVVVGVRLDRGDAGTSRAIAAIDHPEVVAYGEARRHGRRCPVELRGGARYVEPLTGLSVVARVRRPGGPWRSITLHDELGDGDYRAWAALPDGSWSGHLEIRSTDSPLVAGLGHALLHADKPEEVGKGTVDAAAFVRHVPLSFAAGPVKDPSGRVPKDEKKPRRPGGR